MTSLSKAGGRKAAVSGLLGAVEQARAEAIKSGQATYVVFPTFTAASQSTLDRYNCKSYAIFEDDQANPSAPKQLTNWKTLPAGIALRSNSGSGSAITNLALPTALPAPVPAFTFSPESAASTTYYLIKFNSSGEIEAPPGNVTLGVFEGFVVNAAEAFTSGKDKNGNPIASEYLAIAQHTGRAVATITPTP